MSLVSLVRNIAVCDVCFCRLLSQHADVNIQSGVGMSTFYGVSYVTVVL